MIDLAVVLAVGDINHQSKLVYNRPRAMLPALGKPLVVRVMDRLYRADIRRFIVVVGEDEGDVASYLNAHWVPDANIEYVLKFNNDTLARILSDIARKIGGPFLITAYNSFTHSQFYSSVQTHHQEAPEKLILTGSGMTLSKSRRRQYALLEGERVTDIVESVPADATAMNLTNLSVCGQHFVDYLIRIPPEVGGMESERFTSIVRSYIQQDDSDTALAETGWTLQTDTDADLLTLNRSLLDDGQDAYILSELPPSVRVIPPVRIDPQVSIGQGAQIGPYVYLERGSSIGAGAVVRHAIVTERANVSAHDTISNVIMTSMGPVT